MRYRVEHPPPAVTGWPAERAAAAHRIGDRLWPKSFVADFEADVEAPFRVGVVVGSAGSGRTTAIGAMFPQAGAARFSERRPVIDQLPVGWTPAERARLLLHAGMGNATSWLRPVGDLSHGERAAARLALSLAVEPVSVADPWEPERLEPLAAAVAARRLRRLWGRSVPNLGALVVALTRRELVEELRPDWVLDTATWSFSHRRRGLHPPPPRLVLSVVEPSRQQFAELRYLLHPIVPPGPRHMALTPSGALAALCAWKVGRSRGPRRAYLFGLHVDPVFRGVGLEARFLARSAEDIPGFEPRVSAQSEWLAEALEDSPLWRREERRRSGSGDGFSLGDLGGYFTLAKPRPGRGHPTPLWLRSPAPWRRRHDNGDEQHG